MHCVAYRALRETGVGCCRVFPAAHARWAFQPPCTYTAAHAGIHPRSRLVCLSLFPTLSLITPQVETYDGRVVPAAHVFVSGPLSRLPREVVPCERYMRLLRDGGAFNFLDPVYQVRGGWGGLNACSHQLVVTHAGLDR